ncbi:hypothetical protein LC609_29130 [Nostoc sp. XA013]|nr:hypothetical protein [Nostoc sp. XA013]
MSDVYSRCTDGRSPYFGRWERSLHHQFSQNSFNSKTSLCTWFWLNSLRLPLESLKMKGALIRELDRWL